MDGPGFLLFSGANDRAVLSLCRGFARHQVPFGLIARGADDLLKHSHYADHFLLQRAGEAVRSEEVIEAVQIGRERFHVDRWVVCATSEYLNLRLFEFKDELERAGITVATCHEQLYLRLSNKSTFRKYCSEIGVPTPALLEAANASTEALPFVAKPRSNLGSNGRILYPHLVRTEADRQSFLTVPEQDEYYMERYIEGESWYYLYYFAADGTYVSGDQRNLLQQGQGKSIVLAKTEDYPEREVSGLFAQALLRDGYRGFIMVEVKRTKNGQAIAIEANPRCWGPFQLTLDANLGLFELFLRDHGHQVKVPVRKPLAHYCWTGGMVKSWLSKRGLDRHVPLGSLISMIFLGLRADVYARKDSWSCFLRDIR